MENEIASEILRKAGKKNYSGFEWQLVQTHLVLPSGKVKELWRPGKDAGDDSAQDLLAHLDSQIEQLNLRRQKVLSPYVNPRLVTGPPNEVVLQVGLRVPVQENHPHDSVATTDWIILSDNHLSYFEKAITLPQSLPENLAADILIHLRPPLDRSEDPKSEALKLVRTASLRLAPVSGMDNWVGIEGFIRLQRAAELPEPNNFADKWTEIIASEVNLVGFAQMSPSPPRIVDLQIVSTEAFVIPPSKKKITYKVSAHLTPKISARAK